MDEGSAGVGLISFENQNLQRQFQLAVLAVLSALHFLVIFDFETKLFV
jgi:hypothetical protein